MASTPGILIEVYLTFLMIEHVNCLFFVFMFSVIKGKVYRSSLCSIFIEISKHFQFGMKISRGAVLANVFLKQLCKALTPRDGKESKQYY